MANNRFMLLVIEKKKQMNNFVKVDIEYFLTFYLFPRTTFR